MPTQRKWLKRVLMIFLLTRLFTAGALYAWYFGPFQHNQPGPNEPIWHGDHAVYPRWVEPWRRWDALWFINLSRDGYQYRANAQSNVTVFPLYSWLMRLGGRGTAGAAVAGLLISNLCLLAGCVLMYRIFREYAGDAGAERALAAMLLFPASFVFSGIYAESLLIVASAAAWWLGMRDRWFWAGVGAALATLTRFTGILILLPLGVMWFESWRRGTARAGSAAWLLLAPAAAGAHFLHLQTITGSFWTYFMGQSHWGKVFSDPLTGLFYELTMGFKFDPMFNSACAVGFVALGVAVWKRYGAAPGVYTLAGALLPMCQSKLLGMPRYAAALFPAFLIPSALGEKHPWLYRLWLAVSCGLLVYCLIRFSNWEISF